LIPHVCHPGKGSQAWKQFQIRLHEDRAAQAKEIHRMGAFRSSKLFNPVTALCLVLLGLAAAGYWVSGPGWLIAQTASPVLSPEQERAIEHANALSEAFRAASDRVVPAVVTIQHEIKPKMVRQDVRPRGDSRLPKEFEDLDPLLKRFFEDMPGMDEFDMPSMPQQSSGSGVIIDKSGVILTNNHVVAGGGKSPSSFMTNANTKPST
jgi:serine protease Do